MAVAPGVPGRFSVNTSVRTEPQEVELPFRNLADACLFRVDRQLQLTHEFAHPMQCFFGLASSAQDHEIVGKGHDPTAEG